MNEPHDPVEDPMDPTPTDPFEAELVDRLDALVRHELPPYDLAARAQARAGAHVAAHRRRSLARGGGVAVLAAAAVWAAVAVGSGIGDQRDPGVRTADGGPTTIVAPSTTSSSSTSSTSSSTTSTTRPRGVGQGGDDPTSPTTAPTVVGGTATTLASAPERRCVEVTGEPNDVRKRWSTEDSKTGPAAYWRTQPAVDQPLTIEACIDDVTPAVGQTVTITLVAKDPDQAFDAESCNAPRVEWGDTARIMSLCGDAVPPPPASPATTPTPGPAGEVRTSEAHQYTEAGSFTILVTATSGTDSGGPEPYRSGAVLELPVTVRPSA